MRKKLPIVATTVVSVAILLAILFSTITACKCITAQESHSKKILNGYEEEHPEEVSAAEKSRIKSFSSTRLLSLTHALKDPDTTYQDGICVVSKYQRLCPSPENPELSITIDDTGTVSLEQGGMVTFQYINNIVGQKGDFNNDAFCGIEDVAPFNECLQGVGLTTNESCRFNSHYDCDEDTDLQDWSKFQLGFGTGNVQVPF